MRVMIDTNIFISAVAEAYYRNIPEEIMAEGVRFVDIGFKNVINDFMDKYGNRNR